MSDDAARSLRIGLLQLADSAPVMVARAFGLFARHGIAAEIAVEPSWANLADKLTWGMLDAAVMFAPLAIITATGARGRAVPLHLAQPLSRGGNMIVLRGERSASFAAWALGLGRLPRIAVVHIHSTHHLILRRFLATQGVEPENGIELLVMPPANIVEALEAGEIDGFCAGAPWGAEAIGRSLGFEIAGSRHLVPGHLEKSLFVAASWLDADPSRLARLGHALREARALCADPANHNDIAALLTAPIAEGGLGLPLGATASAFAADLQTGERLDFRPVEPVTVQDLAWQLSDMRRLGWMADDALPFALIEPAPLP